MGYLEFRLNHPAEITREEKGEKGGDCRLKMSKGQYMLPLCSPFGAQVELTFSCSTATKSNPIKLKRYPAAASYRPERRYGLKQVTGHKKPSVTLYTQGAARPNKTSFSFLSSVFYHTCSNLVIYVDI